VLVSGHAVTPDVIYDAKIPASPECCRQRVGLRAGVTERDAGGVELCLADGQGSQVAAAVRPSRGRDQDRHCGSDLQAVNAMGAVPSLKAGGSISGYRWGIRRERQLLALEKAA
jgi:hypothetical protein